MSFQLTQITETPQTRNCSTIFAVSLKNSKPYPLRRRDYDKLGRFHSGTISRRFRGWNSALLRAGLHVGRQCHIPDEELLEDVQRVAREIAPRKVTQCVYNEKGQYTAFTISERLGWNRALRQLNLETSCRFDLSEAELFQNMQSVWLTLGRQPGRRDMVQPLSKLSERPYLTRYHTWRGALEAFVEYINTKDLAAEEQCKAELATPAALPKERIRHKTKRDIGERLKVRVLIRDGNRCRFCGVVVTGDNIHFDHIKPWSKGGETVLENIQVLCAKHNLAKGNFYEE